MAAFALRLGLVLVALASAIAGLVRGERAALTAAAGVIVVIAMFASTGWSLAWAARRGAGMLMAVALGGFVTRVMLLGVAAAVLASADVVDAPVLVVVVGAAEVLLLALEARFVLRHRELWWLTPVPSLVATGSAAVSEGRSHGE